MDWVTGIQRALDYTEAHLLGEVDYEETAREACSLAFLFQNALRLHAGRPHPDASPGFCR